MNSYPTEHMNDAEFVELARAILEKFDTDHFSDDLLMITTNMNGLGLEITRKAQPVDRKDPKVGHLIVSNPTTMVTREGEIIRHHGEHCYLVPHMMDLLQ